MGAALNTELEASQFGILCLTPENLDSPWLLFEAGSISKMVEDSHVVPFLLGLRPADVTFPLAQFQSVEATESGTLKLFRAINAARDEPMTDERLERIFNRWWPDLKDKLDQIENTKGGNVEKKEVRSDRAVLEEIL